MPGAGALTVGGGTSSGSGQGNPQQLNRYTYVLNNPVLNTDPTGHFCVGLVVVVCAVAVGAYVLLAGATIATQPANISGPSIPSPQQVAERVIPDWVKAAPAVVSTIKDVAPVIVAVDSMAVDEATGRSPMVNEAKQNRQSGKEKKDDVPSWARGKKAKPGETPNEAAERIMNDQYGEDGWDHRETGQGTEYSQIRKTVSSNRNSGRGGEKKKGK